MSNLGVFNGVYRPCVPSYLAKILIKFLGQSCVSDHDYFGRIFSVLDVGLFDFGTDEQPYHEKSVFIIWDH